MKGMARPEVPTRERIISAANALFYNDGIRGVSVDAVAEKAGLHEPVAIGEESAVDLGEWKVLPVAIEQHGLARRSGKSDHGVAERDGVIGVAARIERCDEAVEIDFLGVEQRTVHVEQDGIDIPLRSHVAPARCPASLRRQSGQRQSLLSVGIGRRNISSEHQHAPDRLQLNSAPHPVQARRRTG
jgi:hypothetical protein